LKEFSGRWSFCARMIAYQIRNRDEINLEDLYYDIEKSIIKELT